MSFASIHFHTLTLSCLCVPVIHGENNLEDYLYIFGIIWHCILVTNLTNGKLHKILMSIHLKGVKNSLAHELFMLLRWIVLLSRACIKMTAYYILIIRENFGTKLFSCRMSENFVSWTILSRVHWIFHAPSVINMCSTNDKVPYFQVVLKEEPSLCDDTESTNELLPSTGNRNQENVNTDTVHCIHR